MYRSILVPLDGSSFGERALPLAARIARRSGAELRLVHVHDQEVEPEHPSLTPYRFEGLDARVLDRRTEAEEGAYLEEVSRRLTESAPVALATVVVEGGLIAALERYVRESGGDLLVMSTHGRGALGRMWLGSVADTLVRRAGKPVLLIHAHEGGAAEDLALEPTVERIMVTLDGSPLAEQVLPYACELASVLLAQIELVTVVTPAMVAGHAFGGNGSAGAGAVMDAAQEYLRNVAGRLCQKGQSVQIQAAAASDPAAAVLEMADQRGAGLLALATHGRGGISRLVAGSVAEKVVHGTHVPVLLVRPAVGS